MFNTYIPQGSYLSHALARTCWLAAHLRPTILQEVHHVRLANVWLRRLAGAAPGSSEDLELYQRWEPRGGQEIVVRWALDFRFGSLKQSHPEDSDTKLNRQGWSSEAAD